MKINSSNEINIYNRYLENKNDVGILSIPLLTIEGKPQKIIINNDYHIIFDYTSNLVHHINNKLNYKSTDPIFFINSHIQEVHNYDATTYNKNNIVQLDSITKEIFIKYTPIKMEPLLKSKLSFHDNEINIQIQEGKYEIITQFVENNKFYEQRNEINITEENHIIKMQIPYYEYYAIIIEYDNIEEKHIIYGTLENQHGKYLLNLSNNTLYHPQNSYEFMVKIIKTHLNTEQNVEDFILYIKSNDCTELTFYELFVDTRISSTTKKLLIEKMKEFHTKYKINKMHSDLTEYNLPMEKPSYFFDQYDNSKKEINYINYNNIIPLNPPKNYNENKINWLNRLSKNHYCLNCSQINYCQALMPTINKKLSNYKNCFWE